MKAVRLGVLGVALFASHAAVADVAFLRLGDSGNICSAQGDTYEELVADAQKSHYQECFYHPSKVIKECTGRGYWTHLYLWSETSGTLYNVHGCGIEAANLEEFVQFVRVWCSQRDDCRRAHERLRSTDRGYIAIWDYGYDSNPGVTFTRPCWTQMERDMRCDALLLK